MKLPEFPQEIKRGSISVAVYATPTKGYSAYTLSYYQDGHRKREMSTHYPAIRKRAEEVLDDLSTGRTPETGALKASERDEFLRAKMAIAKVSHIVKAPLPLDLVARHYAQAVRILGNDLVIEAAREYGRRHPVKLPPIKVADLVTEFLAEKEKQERSDRHVETLKSHCTRFGAKVSMNIGSVTAADVDLFLDGLEVASRTRDNIADSIRSLFEYAKRKRYLPSDHDEMKRVTHLSNDEDGPIEIYTLKEMKALLNAAGDLLTPFIAIGGFAGLRSSEIQRLAWADVKFDSNCIIVQKGKVKKRGKSRRIVPMLPNLKSWLKPFAKDTGQVWPHSKPYLYEALAVVATDAKVSWKNNALRHSFVSYRVAQIMNVPQVAYESGNSPQMIDSNYRELVTEQEAKKWFGLRHIDKKVAISLVKVEADTKV
jgi:integrase